MEDISRMVIWSTRIWSRAAQPADETNFLRRNNTAYRELCARKNERRVSVVNRFFFIFLSKFISNGSVNCKVKNGGLSVASHVRPNSLPSTLFPQTSSSEKINTRFHSISPHIGYIGTEVLLATAQDIIIIKILFSSGPTAARERERERARTALLMSEPLIVVSNIVPIDALLAYFIGL